MLIRNAGDLGALIRDRRVKLGLDQQTLAKKAGTSRKWLIEIENGKPRAEIGLILCTLKALDVTLTASDEGAAARPHRVKTPAAMIDQVIDSLKKRR